MSTKTKGTVFTLEGKYAFADIMALTIDEKAYEQINALIDAPVSRLSDVIIMPDCHAGVGCTIGTTMTIKDRVAPSLVGVDIGCGVLTCPLGKIDIDYQKLDDFIRKNIPYGNNIHKGDTKMTLKFLEDLKCYNKIGNLDRVRNSLGTLGGGNHFIEIDEDEQGFKYLLVHSGSRQLGVLIANFYQDLATKQHDSNQRLRDEVVTKMKEEGLEQEISYALKAVSNRTKRTWDKSLDYLTGQDLKDYINDMQIAQKYAAYNRRLIALRIMSKGLEINITAYDSNGIFDTVHNYIGEDRILRKGAISAYHNEKCIIPINMRDGALLCRGKSNFLWNYSAPHGAGRLMSRREAKDTLSLDDFKESMKGVWSSTVNESTLDEAPDAYKPIDEIIDLIGDTVHVDAIIKPVYNFKGGKD